MNRHLAAGLAALVAVPMLASTAEASVTPESRYPIPHAVYNFQIAANQTFSTSLVIPVVTCNKPDAAVTFLTGIGGRFGALAVGIDVDCQQGQPEYRPYVKVLGEGPRRHLKKHVAPGDSIKFSLVVTGGAVNAQIDDTTAGWGWALNQPVSGKPTDVVAAVGQRRESPAALYPLADFGKVHFINTYIGDSPIKGPIYRHRMDGFPTGKLVRTSRFDRRDGVGSMTWLHE